jgi:hypothetical protein
MSSFRRTISSRPNASRSRGPTTPTGTTRSSRNATRPGLEQEMGSLQALNSPENIKLRTESG